LRERKREHKARARKRQGYQRVLSEKLGDKKRDDENQLYPLSKPLIDA